MQTNILFFGQLRAQLGAERMIDLPDQGCSVAELRERLIGKDADIAAALQRPGIKVAVDQRIVADDVHILPGQEIAFLSPLSGG